MTGQSTTAALLKELDELHFNGGILAFQKVIAKINSTFIRGDHQELLRRLREEADPLGQAQNPEFGTALKQIELCQRKVAAEAQSNNSEESVHEESAVGVLHHDMCDQ